jgi:hypothetical protein
MARRRALAVVPEGAEVPTPKTFTVTAAAAEGTRRDLLVSMRARVATAVEDGVTPARDLAALTRRLMEIAREIDAIDAATKQEAAENGASADEAFDASAV